MTRMSNDKHRFNRLRLFMAIRNHPALIFLLFLLTGSIFYTLYALGLGLTKQEKEPFYTRNSKRLDQLQEQINKSGTTSPVILSHDLVELIINLSQEISPRQPDNNLLPLSPERGELFNSLMKYRFDTGKLFSRACFDHAELNGTNIRSKNLSGGQFQSVLWNNGELKYCRLIGIDMENSHLQKTNFQRSNLTHANLSGSNLYAANFQSAILNGIDLSETNLEGSNFYEARVNNAQMGRSNLKGAILGKIYWRNINARECNLEGIKIQEQSSLNTWDLSKASLSGVTLNGVGFYNTKLENTNLLGVSMVKCSLRSVNLRGANLVNANLTRAWISDSDLSKANLQSINAKGLKCDDCDLTCANFSGSNLRNLKESDLGFFERVSYDAYYPNKKDEILKTRFNNSTLDYAIFDNTILPEGLTVKSATGTRWPDGYSTTTLTITNPNPPDPELKKIQDEWLNKP
jgi:uncharacterized protein YjbI with pentapeptide repeats